VNLKPRILAVDDDPTARLFIALTLSPLPVDVYVTATCREFSVFDRSEPAPLGVPMIVGSAVRQILAITSAMYGPDSDFTSMVKSVERWAGVEVGG
jgi:CheY-like chemotaxis protein